MYMYYVIPGTGGGQTRALELQVVVSYHLGARNCILHKSNQGP